MNVNGLKCEPLNHESYDSWKVKVKAFLQIQGLWKYINGECIKPETSATNEALQLDQRRGYSNVDADHDGRIIGNWRVLHFQGRRGTPRNCFRSFIRTYSARRGRGQTAERDTSQYSSTIFPGGALYVFLSRRGPCSRLSRSTKITRKLGRLERA